MRVGARTFLMITRRVPYRFDRASMEKKLFANVSRVLPEQRKPGHEINSSKTMIHHDDLTDFLTQPRLDTCLIGIANTLHKEARLQLKSMGHAGKGKGTLQDLIRCRRFLSDGQAYRTDLIPSSASQLAQQLPYATVFDGALAYLRCRDECRGTHQIIALDRSGAHFHDATNIINQAYLNRANSDTRTLPSPAGVETLVFDEYQP